MRNHTILSFLFIIIAGILYSQFIKPWYGTAIIRQEHIDRLREVFSKGEVLQERRDALLAEFNAIRPDTVQRVREAIPEHSSSNVVRFFIELNQLLQISGLPLDTAYGIGGERSESETVVAVPVTFTFTDMNYSVLRSFIVKLQQWSRGVRIVSVQIDASSNDTGGTGTVDAIIVIEALFSQVITDL